MDVQEGAEQRPGGGEGGAAHVQVDGVVPRGSGGATGVERTGGWTPTCDDGRRERGFAPLRRPPRQWGSI
eukprot:3516359-Pleurochrysis_carterae.AAC.1